MQIKPPKHNWKKYCHGSISLCMIMKNEAKRLPRCLASVQGLVDEIIITDTGSTDKSIEVAQKLGARVIIDPWHDDFAYPRNLSIGKATKSWILILDPDEVVDRRDFQHFRDLTHSKKYAAFRITTKNYTGARQEPHFSKVPKNDPFSQGLAGYTPSVKTRFFKNGLGIKFIGCYHELLDYFLMKNKIPTGTANIFIHHWVHEISQQDHKQKIRFYLRLAAKKISQEPDNAHAWHEAGVTYAIAGQRQKALLCMLKSLYMGHSDKTTLMAISRLYHVLDRPADSKMAFEKVICDMFPNLTHISNDLKSPKCLKL